MTPDQARVSAKSILAAVALGQDPARKRSTERAMPTFSDFAERYLAEEAAAKLKPRTVVNYRIYLRKHASPLLGTRKLDALDSADVSKMHRRIGKMTPMTANRVVEFVGPEDIDTPPFCGLVIKGHNPATHVQAFREQRRERFLSSAELGRRYAIREAETTGISWIVDREQPGTKHIPKNGRTKIGPHVAAALRLLILTGARLREILGLNGTSAFSVECFCCRTAKRVRKRSFLMPPLSIFSAGYLLNVHNYVIASDIEGQPRHDLNKPWKLIIRGHN